MPVEAQLIANVAVQETTPDSSERSDAVSAMVSARATDQRVEDTSQRTETTRVFANPDGTWTAEDAAEPVRTQNEDGAWADIDTDLVATDDGYEPKTAIGGLVLSSGGDKTTAAMNVKDRVLRWQWPTTLPTPVIDGNTATYQDAVAGGDLVVTATPSGFSQDIVLRQAPANDVSFKIPVLTGGPKLTEGAEGDLAITTAAGVDLVTAPQPVMYDSSEDAVGEPENMATVDMTVTKNSGPSGGGTLTLSPDQDFLTDPATVYPVTVDPAFTSYALGDTWITNTDNTSHVTSEDLRVGSVNSGATKSRTFMNFGDARWAGKHIEHAELRMSNFYAVSCTASSVEATRITEDWAKATLTWANQPTVTTSGSDYYAPAHGYTGCPAAQAEWDIGGIVQAWADGSPRLGIRLKAVSETSANGYRRYRSTEYSAASTDTPRLTVTYNSYPAKPSGVTITPSQTGWVSTETPKLGAVVSDPDKGNVKAHFNVYSGSTLAWSGDGSVVTSGRTSSISVPVNRLTNGASYTVKAYATDGSLCSDRTSASSCAGSAGYATGSFTVDTTSPSAAVTSSAYTSGQWLVTPPSSNSFTLNGDSDVASFVIDRDGVASTSAADSSGDAVVSWNPDSGAHVLEVTPVDKAGNYGSASSFSFGTGQAGFNQPTVAERSTKTFPVNIGGPPNATSAALSWRVTGTTSWNAATSVRLTTDESWDGTVTPSGSGSTSGDLIWDATDETDPGTNENLMAPALLEVRACFAYAAAGSVCTEPRRVQLVPSAFGGNFPVATVGPADVALFTGEMSLTDVDAADSRAGLGRTFTSFDASTVTGGVFGPGWSDVPMLAASPDASANVIDNRDKDGTFVIVDSQGGSQAFVPVSGSSTSFVPFESMGDATELKYSEGSPASLELIRPLGSASVRTSWTLAASDEGEPAWVLDSANVPGNANDVTVATEAHRPVWVRESPSDASSTCTRDRQTVGCRALTIAYTGTGAAMRVTSVARVIGAADQNEVKSRGLATYAYDVSGKLTSVCGPQTGATASALCVTYEYATVDGRTVISTMATPPGLKPWQFDFDSTGRLQTVTRERPDSGNSVWSVDYSLSVSASTLPDMSSSAISQWGQDVEPTHVIAVYEPTVGTPDITNAVLHYTTDDGTETNTAAYGPTDWLVDTTWYNDTGHPVRLLDARGWARVQAASPAQRNATSIQASSFMNYNTYGDADKIGTRIVDTYGPAHTSRLRNGESGLWRQHTADVFDDDPNAPSALLSGRPQLPAGPDGSASTGLGLPVKEVDSVSDAGMTTDYDSVATKTMYNPVVNGDGDGWALGIPVTVSSQAGGTGADDTWSTSITRFDQEGLAVETRQPGGGADASGAGNDALATITEYYTAGGSGDCANKPLWAGLVCKSRPAGQPQAPNVPSTWLKTYDDELRPTVAEESVNGTTVRTSTSSYDELGRLTNSSIQTTGSSVTNETITTTNDYDPTNGLPKTVTRNGKSIIRQYDSWGRTTSYSDALGTVSTTTYDAAGNTKTRTDGSSTYTYGYNSHGVLTSVDSGGITGVFEYDYLPDGAVDTMTYPNGVTASNSYDEVGSRIALDYSKGSTDLLGFTDTLDANSSVSASSSPQSEKTYTNDAAGRLTKTQEDAGSDEGCTTRTYTFDEASNRTGSSTYAPASSDGACQSTIAAISKTSTFDSGGRIRNSGYVYDGLGRTLVTPDADVMGTSDVTATYHANDMIASMSQDVVNNSTGETQSIATAYALDPAQRINSITSSADGAEVERIRYRYATDADSPSVVESSIDSGSTWTNSRYITLPGIGMAASEAGSTVVFQLPNLNGDIVAIAPSGSTPSISVYSETDEYGLTSGGSPSARYGYQGNEQRSTDTPGHSTILMGLRVYNPVTGMFLSPDSVRGGTETNYTYPENPINTSDLSGACSNDRSGVQPILDTHGWVGVPNAYCVDTHGAHKGWHDYCTHAWDGYGSVSFKGPCAYHDMCLQYRWAVSRSVCDKIFESELMRNCKYYFDRHDSSGHGRHAFNQGHCYRQAFYYFAAVSLKTDNGGEDNYLPGNGMKCYLNIIKGNIGCW